MIGPGLSDNPIVFLQTFFFLTGADRKDSLASFFEELEDESLEQPLGVLPQRGESCGRRRE